MFRRIVVPLDGSPFARAAVPYALALATEPDSTVELVSAVDVLSALGGTSYAGDISAGAGTGIGWGASPDIPAAANQLIEASRSGREEDLGATAERLRSATGTTVRWTVLDGEPSDAVARQIEETDAELVVMSTHGRGGMERAWLGSVADRLIRRVTVPLLLVRPREDEPKGEGGLAAAPAMGRVLVPLDGSALAEAALGPAARLARSVGATVVLVRVTQPVGFVGSPYVAPIAEEEGEDEGREEQEEARRYLTEVAERLRSDGIEVADPEVREGVPAATILDVARERADIVAMATHGRGGFRRWLLGSVSDKVVRGADLPVLLVRPADAGESGEGLG